MTTSADFTDQRAAVEPLLAVVPFLGGMDYPSSPCGVIDREGLVHAADPSPSVLMAKQPVLSGADGRSFVEYVRDVVAAG